MSEAQTPEELKELGNKAFAAKKFDEAIELYSKAIKKNPSNHVFFSNRSASYAGKMEWEKAANDAKECIRLEPSFIKGYYRLATAQTELKDYDGAIATIRQGLNIDANNTQLQKQMRTAKSLKKQSTMMSQQQSLPKNGAPRLLDAATTKELQDLQVQFNQSNRELNTVNANLVKTQREYKMHDITKKELLKLSEDTNCYRSVGKIFIRSKQKKEIEYLDQKMEEHSKSEADMTQRMEYLQRRMKSQQQNIQELVSSAS